MLISYPDCRGICWNKHGKLIYFIIPLLLTFIQPRKHAQATNTITTTIEVADADIKEAKKEWEDLVLSDKD